jgi:hypothetical protein
MTHLQSNPFVYDQPVSGANFIGREDVIYACYNSLAGRTIGRPPTSIAISGNPGMGKTSLLHHITDLARAEGWGQPYTNLFVYVDCLAFEQWTPDHFWRRILGLMKQSEDNPGLQELIDGLLQRTELNAIDLGGLRKWLEEQRFTVIWELDNFEWLVNADKALRKTVIDFLNNLRFLADSPPGPIVFFVVSDRPLNAVCEGFEFIDPSPFSNVFDLRPLSPFSSDEITALLQHALAGTGLEFDRADRAFLTRLAGTLPLLVQMAGFYLFERRRDALLTDQIYAQVTEAFEQASRPYFSRLWNRSSSDERALLSLATLRYLALQSRLPTDVRTDEIDGVFQQHQKTITPLTRGGLVQKAGDSYRLFSDVFAWWVAREVAAESESALTFPPGTTRAELLRHAWETLKEVEPHLTLDRQTQTLIFRAV